MNSIANDVMENQCHKRDILLVCPNLLTYPNVTYLK